MCLLRSLEWSVILGACWILIPMAQSSTLWAWQLTLEGFQHLHGFLLVKLDTLLEGILLLGVFSLGLGIPFILASIFISFFSKFLKRLNRHLNLVSIISGIFIIVLGVVFVTDSMIRVIGYLSRYIPIIDKINF